MRAPAPTRRPTRLPERPREARAPLPNPLPAARGEGTGAARGEGTGAARGEGTGAVDVGAETVVTATTPLHGSRLPRDRVPANVQTVTADAIAARHSLDLTDYMLDTLGSVSGNQVQQNPLQPDLQYRGFLASPLLGAPQGLSVYIDGVRLNEPFGDTLSWDLIPTEAIRSANLMPGSNPIYGLNTLGGALSLETKTGFSDPGAEVHLLGGSFGRRLLDVGIGGHGQRWGVFAAGRYFGEEGWRPFSPSRTASAFVATTYRNGATSAELALTAADTTLTGNGPAPRQLLALDRRAIFTHPDRTDNRLFMAVARGERPLAAFALLSGVAYYRASRIATVNGDQADWIGCQDPAAGRLRLHQRRCRRRDAGARRRRQPDPVRSPQPVQRVRERDAHAAAGLRRLRPDRRRGAGRGPREPPVRRRRRQRGPGGLRVVERAGPPVAEPRRGVERHRRRRIARRRRQRDARPRPVRHRHVFAAPRPVRDGGGALQRVGAVARGSAGRRAHRPAHVSPAESRPGCQLPAAARSSAGTPATASRRACRRRWS